MHKPNNAISDLDFLFDAAIYITAMLVFMRVGLRNHMIRHGKKQFFIARKKQRDSALAWQRANGNERHSVDNS